MVDELQSKIDDLERENKELREIILDLEGCVDDIRYKTEEFYKIVNSIE